MAVDLSLVFKATTTEYFIIRRKTISPVTQNLSSSEITERLNIQRGTRMRNYWISGKCIVQVKFWSPHTWSAMNVGEGIVRGTVGPGTRWRQRGVEGRIRPYQREKERERVGQLHRVCVILLNLKKPTICNNATLSRDTQLQCKGTLASFSVKSNRHYSIYYIIQ